MEFTDGPIAGVIVRPLRLFRDDRGWLAEVFRSDEPEAGPMPAMAYISETRPGVVRGPHEHVEQTDTFAFAGPSEFRVWLWDNRAGSPTYRRRMIVTEGQRQPTVVVVPPGVVHAYRNVGAVPGLVFNCPDALYKGPGRAAPVDEIRHEDDPESPFRAE